MPTALFEHASLNKNENPTSCAAWSTKTFARPACSQAPTVKSCRDRGRHELAEKRNQDFTRDVAGANHLSRVAVVQRVARKTENQLEPMVEKARKKRPSWAMCRPSGKSGEGVQYILRPDRAIEACSLAEESMANHYI